MPALTTDRADCADCVTTTPTAVTMSLLAALSVTMSSVVLHAARCTYALASWWEAATVHVVIAWSEAVTVQHPGHVQHHGPGSTAVSG